MKVTNHGKYYSNKHTHFDLYGKCNTCGCEFETYLDIHHDVPVKGGIVMITDKDCTDMKTKPEFVYAEDWGPMDGPLRFLKVREIKAIQSVDCSCMCPECHEDVELKTLLHFRG